MRNSPLSFSVNLRMSSSQRQFSFDNWILFSVLILSLFGLAMIYSSSHSVEMTIRQGVYLIIGFVGLFLLAISNFRKMEIFYLHSFWIGLVLLVVVLLIPSNGEETKRWIDFGIFTLQPSELMRFILPISAASFLTRHPVTKTKDSWFEIFITY